MLVLALTFPPGTQSLVLTALESAMKMESNHELVVSTLCFKIKAKRRHTGTSRYQTTNVSTSRQAGYQVTYREIVYE